MINRKSDKDLVKNIKRGQKVDESLCELVDRNSGIFIKMVNKYSNKHQRLDLIGDKEYYIYQAALKYDEAKNVKFSTHLGVESKWLCINNYNLNKKRNEIDLSAVDNFIESENLKDSIQSKDCIEKILEFTESHPDKRVSKIFQLRYNDGHNNKLKPWSEICDEVGLSVQGSILVHDEAISSIKRKLKKEI